MGNLKPVSMHLYLADGSSVVPMGVMDDIPIQVGKFIVPVDFIVMDIPADTDVPIILGRPFLATVGVLINVKEGKITFSIGDEEIRFDFRKILKDPTPNDDFYRVKE